MEEVSHERPHTVRFQVFYERSRIGKFTETETRLEIVGGGGLGREHGWAQGFFLRDENVLELVVMVTQH